MYPFTVWAPEPYFYVTFWICYNILNSAIDFLASYITIVKIKNSPSHAFLRILSKEAWPLGLHPKGSMASQGGKETERTYSHCICISTGSPCGQPVFLFLSLYKNLFSELSFLKGFLMKCRPKGY